ncbi:MAG: ABC transporter ATP-binding protein [Clostridiales bacterium]|nr:ABC transporter ATP-binding protein [Clostridiales bacterium]
MSLLEIKNLNCAYGNVQVLWDVSLSVEQAEIVALLGANGAGKTTLLNTITGFVRPMSGEICFMGERIDGRPTNAITEMGIAYLPEGGKLFPDMTIRENLEMGAYPKHIWKERKELIDMVFELFPRLNERQKQLARTLSGGEQQMLALGRGLMSRPKLFLIDELSYGLAPIIVSEVFRIVQTLRERGITILLVEQNVRQTLEIADRAYVLENGRMVLCDKCCNLLENEYVKKAYLGL